MAHQLLKNYQSKMSRRPDLNRTMDDNMSLLSVQTTLSGNRKTGIRERSGTRKRIKDLRTKLVQMSQENQNLVSKMGDMFKEMDTTMSRRGSHRRTSLGPKDKDSTFDLGINPKFLQTGPVEIIKEVEEEEIDKYDRLSVFSVAIKDDVTKAKEKMEEYNQLIKDMTSEIELLDKENLTLEKNMEEVYLELEKEIQRSNMLSNELEKLKKENEKIVEQSDNLVTQTQNLKFELEEQTQLTKKFEKMTGRMGAEEEEQMMRENEKLIDNNIKLEKKLERLQNELRGKEEQHDLVCSNIGSLQQNRNKMSSQLTNLRLERDDLQDKVELLQETLEKERNERQQNENLIQKEAEEERKRLIKAKEQLETQISTLTTKNLELSKEIEFFKYSERDASVLMIDQSRTYIMDRSMQNNNTFMMNNNSRILDTSLHPKPSFLADNYPQGDISILNDPLKIQLEMANEKILNLEKKIEILNENLKESISQGDEFKFERDQALKKVSFKENMESKKTEHKFKTIKEKLKNSKKRIKILENNLVNKIGRAHV